VGYTAATLTSDARVALTAAIANVLRMPAGSIFIEAVVDVVAPARHLLVSSCTVRVIIITTASLSAVTSSLNAGSALNAALASSFFIAG
jgi:hypothetical protein